MSKSSPPPANAVVDQSAPANSRHTNDAAGEVASTQERPFARIMRRRTFSKQFAAVVRWLHIYVSLLGFAALILFAVTGITLNHPTWFGSDAVRTRTLEGALRREWLQRPASGRQVVSNEAPGVVEQVDRLAVVEHLRQEHAIRGAVKEFRVDDRECLVIFKGPGYSADAFIDLDTGRYELTENVLGAVAVINDLHKGRDTGLAWSVVIDLSALLMVFVSLTGIVLIFYLRRRRRSGIVTAVVGTILVAWAYWQWVP